LRVAAVNGRGTGDFSEDVPMVAIMESSHEVDTKINLIVTVVVIVALYAVGMTTYCLYRTFFRKPIKDQEEDSTAVETSADIETERRIMDTMA
jgi:heme/copper-type cytochrome/quinol oxidase subunit 2